MSQLQTKWIADSAITASKIATTAKQDILQQRLVALRKGVLNFTTTASSSDIVTTEVNAASTDVTPRSDLSTGLGVFTGAITNGVADRKIVIVREAGTNEGIDDGSTNEVYGTITEAASVFTLNYFKSDNTAFTFGGVDSIDFYYVEISDLLNMDPEAHLGEAVNGVVDASSATTLAGHLNGGVNKHDSSEIDVEIDGTNHDIGDLESALGDHDAAITSAASAASTAQGDINTHKDGGANKHDLSEIDNETTGTYHTSGTTSQVALDAIDVGAAAAKTQADLGVTNAATAQAAIDAHNNGGANKHDASEIDVEVIGNYTTIADLETNLGALDTQIKANADAIANATSEEERKETFTLSGGDITNEYIDLAVVPKTASSVRLVPVGGPEQEYSVDFAIITDGADNLRLAWDAVSASTGLVSILAAADKLVVYYQVDA